MLSYLKMLSLVFVALFFLSTEAGFAQNSSLSGLTPDEIRVLVPVGLSNSVIAEISPGGEFSIRRGSRVSDSSALFQMSLWNNASGELIADLGPTQSAAFVDEMTLLWTGNDGALSSRLYELPAMTQTFVFPRSTVPLSNVEARHILPLESGLGFLYISNGIYQFQPSDLSADAVNVIDVGGLLMSANGQSFFLGSTLELPDGTLMLATEFGIHFYNVETRQIVTTLDFPLPSLFGMSDDGSLVTATTNNGTNWIVYDVNNDQVVFEHSGGTLSAHGVISADGRWVAVSTEDFAFSQKGRLSVIDVQTNETIFTLSDIHHGNTNYIAYGRTGNRLSFRRQFDASSFTGLQTYLDFETRALTESETALIWDFPLNESVSYGFTLLNGIGYLVVLETVSGETIRSFRLPSSNAAPLISLSQSGRELIIPPLVYGLESEQTSLTTLSGQANGVNVRTVPNQSGQLVQSATGEVVAIARNTDGTWVYLVSHGGWLRADLVGWDGDVSTLEVIDS